MRKMCNIDIKMPSETSVLPLQTEKPQHYTYLKEFRTQQCPLFLQHKCTQHRPYTCFHWHFLNQRRRRPVRKRDGSFSYSPDVYCTKYDENAGACSDGDDCPYLHRTAGDTERRYHLRYYKTGTCVHETDARGHCVKNGPHCAFAHGAHDLRPPVYDAREHQQMEQAEKNGDSSLFTSLAVSPVSSMDNNKQNTDDPKWNDTEFVLQNYKTEQCKKPPRLCRQGYACPCFHNSRDRRRSPRKHKYRSTPCPNVKHGDDWGDPSICDSGDNCSYCHTRTEQQFHPEIYKSTKCNDMVQSGYCPRGPFCAFAHVEQEMSGTRDLTGSMNSSFGAFLPNTLHGETFNNNKVEEFLSGKESNNNKLPQPIGKERTSSTSSVSSVPLSVASSFTQLQPFPDPIGKGRSSSTSSSISDLSSAGMYQRAPGSEREDTQFQTKLRQQLQAIDNDSGMDMVEKVKQKQNILQLSFNSNGKGTTSSPCTTPTTSSLMSPLARPFFPPGDTVESVIGSALDESDLNLNFDLTSIGIDKDLDNDTNSVSSSISAGFSSSAGFSGQASSNPVTIPIGDTPRSTIGSLSQSPPLPLQSLIPSFVPQQVQQQQRQELQLEQAQAAFLSQPNPGRYAVPGYSDFNSVSPRASNSGSQSPLAAQPSLFNSNNGNSGAEIQRLREELVFNKAKLASWEEGIAQARSACEAWKKEAEESIRKAKAAEEMKNQAIRTRDELLVQLSKLKMDVDRLSGGPFIKCLQKVSELDSLSLGQLKLIQQQLRIDLDKVDKIVYQHTAMKCLLCQDRNRSVAVMPCNHYVLCDTCAPSCRECPYCHLPITQKSSIVLPL